MKYFVGLIIGTVFGVILLWYTTVPPVISNVCIVAPITLKAPVRYIFDCSLTIHIPESKPKLTGHCVKRIEFIGVTDF